MVKYASQTAFLHNVPPQPTPFIGRESEIENIVSLLHDPHCRLLTLVGLGGIGKTRLCIESIKQLTKSQFEHGVFYVPLAALTSSDAIETTVIDVLGLVAGSDGDSRKQLINFLNRRKLLLVMDNYEHLLDDTKIVVDILNAAPEVKIMVTSREVLKLSMERVWHVDGMTVSATGDVDDISKYSALMLFIKRAQWLHHDFDSDEHLDCIVRICQLVEGMPLAIELAVSWLRSVSCSEIVTQIERGIDFFKTRTRDISTRHRSIRAVFNHSWHLLSSDEQQVFQRLTIFRGGFTLEAAVHVAGAELAILSSLVEKSMIRLTKGRYDIHELLRQFANSHLVESDESDLILDQHMQYFGRFMVERIPDLKGGRQIEALNEIRSEIDNIREAWHRVCQYSHYEIFDGMLECLIVFFDLVRYIPIAMHLYEYAIVTLDDSKDVYHLMLRNRLQVAHLYAQMRLSNALLSSQEYLNQMQVCLDVAEQVDDNLSKIFCLMTLAEMNTQKDLPPEMRRALNISEALNDPYYIGSVLDMLIFYYTLINKDDGKIALDYSHRYLELSQACGNLDGIATAYCHLSQCNRFWGDIEDAIINAQEAKRWYQQLEHTQGTAVCNGLSLAYEFQLGRLDKIIQGMKGVQEQLESVGFLASHPFTYMLCAKVEAIKGNYQAGQHYIAEALKYQSKAHTLYNLHEAKIMCAIGLDDWDMVYEEINLALDIDFTFIGDRSMVDFLPFIAFVYAHEGKHAQAVEVLSLAFSHPAGVTQWMHKWRLLMDLCDTLANDLDHDQYNRAWENGKQLDLKSVVAEMAKDVHSAQQDNRLIEPLTPREQDVLALFVVDEYEYRDIAEQLYISVTTVRTHAHHIYQKLGVKNRRQAILKAQQLSLL